MQQDCLPTPNNQYKLKVIRAEDVVWKSRIGHSKLPDLFVEVSWGNISRKTKVIKKSLSPTWDEDMPLIHATASSTISLTLIHQSSLGKLGNESIGTTELMVSDLLGKTGEVSVASVHLKSHDKPSAVLFMQLVVVRAIDNIKQETSSAIQAATSIAHSSRLDTDIATPDLTLATVQQSSDLYSAVGKLVGRLDFVKRILDGLATIHPIVSAAWTVASALYRVVQKQFETDKAVVDLAEKLSECLDFFLDADRVREKLKNGQSVVTVAKLFNQITECCLFIREYTGKGFVGRMLSFGDQKNKIDAFVQALGDLRRDIDQKVNLNTAIVTACVARQVDQLYLETLLKPDIMDVYGRNSCQEGTRVSVLREITDWILTESSQNILWLYGAAGSGKSTIARSIQDYMLNLSRQGAYLRFERGKSVPNGVIRTIAFQLARCDSRISESITSMSGNSDIQTAPILKQFELLLSRPLTACIGSTPGPVVVILDALDECGDPNSRADLLEALEGIAELPFNYRFVITGRPERDLVETFHSSARRGHIHKIELDSGSQETRSDVFKFLRNRLHKLSLRFGTTNLLPAWTQNIAKLAEISSGLFMFASTAAEMVLNNVDPFTTLQELVSGETRPEELDDLYRTVLTNSGLDWKKETSIARFKSIVSFMILCKAPLFASTIDGLLGLSAAHSSSFVLERLSPLISCEPGRPLYFRHVTIFDYFLAPACQSFPWSIDVNPYCYSLAGQCFALMKKSLRFNISGLVSSCYRNDAVLGLKQRLASVIPTHLRYACLYWARHLCDCDVKDPSSGELLAALREFLLEQLLFWVEVLSLLEFKGRDKIFIEASRWLHDLSSTSDTTGFLEDARKLFNMFDMPIGQSTPHIYVSMIPLMQPESIVAAHYYPRISASGIAITHHGTRTRSHRLKTLDTRDNSICSTAFSPVNPTQLVCGYNNGTIDIWDIERGEATHKVVSRHDDTINSMAFTHDGELLVFGTGDGLVGWWNTIKDRKGVLGTHSGGARVHCLGICSTNALVASGFSSGEIKIWGLNGELAASLEVPGQIIRSVVFRPGLHKWSLASSAHHSLCMWNLANNRPKEFSLEDKEYIETIIFTLDGGCLLCGSTAGPIRIRNADTGDVLRIMFGHTDEVSSLQLSPTTNNLLSGSADRTIRLWNIETGAALIEPVQEVTGIRSATWSCDEQHISCFATSLICIYSATTFSANCKLPSDQILDSVIADAPLSAAAISSSNTFIVAGGYDGAVRMWRAGADGTWGAPQLRDGHAGQMISSIAISPDELQIATGSWDESICVWNVDDFEPSCETDSDSDPFVIDIQAEVNDVVFSPISGSPNLASVTEHDARIYNSDTGTLTATLSVDEAIVSVAFSPDGTKLAVACDDGKIRLLDIETGTHTLGGSFKFSETDWVTLSPDGKIASNTLDGSLRVWDTNSGDLLLDLLCELPISSFAFSPSRTHLLSGDYKDSLNLWDIANGKYLLKVPRGHTSTVTSISVSSDSSLIVSSSSDETVRIWDTVKLMSSGPQFQEDGWLVGKQGQLLLWIPSHLRRSLLWSVAQVAVLGPSFVTRVDLSNFREYGWCDLPRAADVEITDYRQCPGTHVRKEMVHQGLTTRQGTVNADTNLFLVDTPTQDLQPSSSWTKDPADGLKVRFEEMSIDNLRDRLARDQASIGAGSSTAEQATGRGSVGQYRSQKRGHTSQSSSDSFSDSVLETSRKPDYKGKGKGSSRKRLKHRHDVESDNLEETPVSE
ncbi:WD40-repeat-containing domain protein [Cytidiella melzeri]|nr:WD40-repeat-containing domain protein [Cytidiella melzeri]